MKTIHCLFLLLIFSFASIQSVQALSLGQVDTFEDGTTQGWSVNLFGMGIPGAPPQNIASGGPAGADDNFLLLTATGAAGGGGRLSVFHFNSHWAGDYVAAGIGLITMDVRNLSGTDLSLRLAFEDPALGSPLNIAFSAEPIFVPSGSDWTSISFPVSAADLLVGLGDVTTALKNTTVLRLYHSPEDNFPNPVNPIPVISAQLAVDNIRAQAHSNIPAVPDQGSTALLLVCALAFISFLRKDRPKTSY